MIALLQRVSSASVTVDSQIIGEIEQGLLVFLAVQPEDTKAKAKRLAERVATYRLFNDDNDKMNLNVKQVDGDILVVSQFFSCNRTVQSCNFQSEPKVSTHLLKLERS